MFTYLLRFSVSKPIISAPNFCVALGARKPRSTKAPEPTGFLYYC